MYCEGLIYRIVCNLNTDIQYIGSTFNELRYRWKSHKGYYKNWLEKKTNKCSIYPYFKQYGIGNFSILPIKKYIVYREHLKDTRHLRVYEQLWISKSKCVNERNTFLILKLSKRLQGIKYRERLGDILKQKKKEYMNRPDVRQHIYEKNKKYAKENPEKMKQYKSEWYDRNKERLSEKHICGCGGKYTEGYKKKHFKTKKHQEFVNI